MYGREGNRTSRTYVMVDWQCGVQLVLVQYVNFDDAEERKRGREERNLAFICILQLSFGVKAILTMVLMGQYLNSFWNCGVEQ